MGLPLILLAASLVKAGVSAAKANAQKAQAAELEAQNQRPTEAVPQSIQDATAIARLMSLVGMPSAQYAAAFRDITRSGANAIAGARERRGGLDVTSAVQQQTDDATLNLNAKSGEMRQQNLVNYIRQLGMQGEWQDKIWNWNNAMKFQENAAAIRSLKTASAANSNSAMNSIFSGIATAAGGMGSGTTTGTAATAGAGVMSQPEQVNIGSGPDWLKGYTDAGQQAPVEDVTVTNADEFDSSTPSSLYNYIKSMQVR